MVTFLLAKQEKVTSGRACPDDVFFSCMFCTHHCPFGNGYVSSCRLSNETCGPKLVAHPLAKQAACRDNKRSALRRKEYVVRVTSGRR